MNCNFVAPVFQYNDIYKRLGSPSGYITISFLVNTETHIPELDV